MKSLEHIGVLEKDEDKGGRRISQAGQRDMDRESSFPGFLVTYMERQSENAPRWQGDLAEGILFDVVGGTFC